MPRRYCSLILLLLLLAVPTHAQPPAASASFPTLAALEAAPLPAADPVELARRLRGVRDIPPPPPAAPARQVGERQRFWVLNPADRREFQVWARLRVISDHLYLWVQDELADGTPVTILDDADLRALAGAFDARIYPGVRELWGGEASPGVDGDPRIYGLFAFGLGPGLAAYFAGRNMYPAAVYPTSNQHDMFIFNLDALVGSGAARLVLPAVESVIAHEFQHMIRANLQLNDAIWLNEGFSSFTQLLLYGDPGAALAFLANPATQLNTWAEDGPRAPHYGASLLFVTYFYERFGLEALRQVSADPGTGLDAFDRVLQARSEPGVDAFFADWAAANYVMDPDLAGGRYGYRLLPSGLPGAQPLATVTTYPYEAAGSVPQYAAAAYTLANLDGLTALEVRLDAPAEARLIPQPPPSGEWFWTGGRGDMSNPTLTRAFDLTGVEAATLRYRVWYHLEDRWDYAYLTVSRDAGQTWDILATPSMTADDPHSAAYGPGYTGLSGGWIEDGVPLDAYAGGEILVRFEVITDDAVSQAGLAVDDVTLPEIGYAADFETDGGGWEAAGWARVDNRLPQRVWLQAIQHLAGDVEIVRWPAAGGGAWTLALAPGVEQVTLMVIPHAPFTTVAMPYTLRVAAAGD